MTRVPPSSRATSIRSYTIFRLCANYRRSWMSEVTSNGHSGNLSAAARISFKLAALETVAFDGGDRRHVSSGRATEHITP